MQKLTLPPWFEQAFSELITAAKIDGAMMERKRIREAVEELWYMNPDRLYEEEIRKIIEHG